MGIYDRDYMKRDTNSFQQEKKKREKPENEKRRINLGKKDESKNRNDNIKHQQRTIHHKNDVVEAQWWNGERWVRGQEERKVIDERPWVRPWLWQVFIFMLVMLAIHKAVEFSKEVRAGNAHERMMIQVQEQQEAEKAARAYKSPYANMPRLPEYTRPQSEPQKAKAETPQVPLVRAPERPPSIIVSEGVTVLERSKDGHYFSSGTVNGFPVVFMVDTGATTVSISMDTASRAGIQECTPARFSTANGDTDGCRAIIPMIEFGGYKISNIEVAILRNLTTHSLLGMNVLKLFKMQQHENRLFFSPNT